MARQINRSRLVDVVITKSAFKTWFQFIRFKQQGIRELIGKYRAFQISARKIFLHGVVLHVHGGHEQKEQIQMDVFRYRKHISVVEIEQFEPLQVEIRRFEGVLVPAHPTTVRRSIQMAHSRALSMQTKTHSRAQGMMNKWKRYFCGHFTVVILANKG
eukprot:187572_1